jgi:hypothetical protein
MVIEIKNSNTCLRYTITALFFLTSNHCPEGYMLSHETRRFFEGFEVTATRWFFDSLIFFFPNT